MLRGLTDEDKRKLDKMWQAHLSSQTTRGNRTRSRSIVNPTPAERFYKAPTGGLPGRGESVTPTATVCNRIKRDASGDFYLADETETILSWAYGVTADAGERMLLAELHTPPDGGGGVSWHLAGHDPCDETEQEQIVPAGVSNASGFTSGFSTGFDSSGYYSTGGGGTGLE